MKDATQQTLTELDTRLMSPQGAALRDSHLTRLHLLAASIHTQLSGGANPSRYAQGRALAQAVDAATTILNQYTITEAPPAESVLTSAPIPKSSPREEN